MRPSLNILEPELIGRIVDEANARPRRGRDGDPRPGDAPAPARARPAARPFRASASCSRATSSSRRSPTRPRRSGCTTATASRTPTSAATASTSCPGSSGLKVLDHRTGETRLANSTDFVEYVRLGDGLANIPYLATAFSTNDDIEAKVSDAWRLYMTLTNSNKPVVSGAFTEHGVPRMVEMMQLFRRDRADLIARPMAIFTITATGNFRYSEDSCQNMIDCVEAGIAVEIVPVTLMGLIAPVTVVGATVFHTVDVLAGITMAQIIRPGAPVLFGGAPATFHMKIASSPMSAIEALQLDAAYVAVAKSLGLPTQSYMALSDGPILDAQAGAETFGSALIAALAGVNSVSGPGMLDFLLVFSLPKLVFDDEMCGQALRFVREVKPLDDLPVGELIDQLMADQHLIMAAAHDGPLAEELYLPSAIVDRDNREAWTPPGRQGHVPAGVRRGRPPAGRVPASSRPTPPSTPSCAAIIRSGLVDQTDAARDPRRRRARPRSRPAWASAGTTAAARPPHGPSARRKHRS